MLATTLPGHTEDGWLANGMLYREQHRPFTAKRTKSYNASPIRWPTSRSVGSSSRTEGGQPPPPLREFPAIEASDGGSDLNRRRWVMGQLRTHSSTREHSRRDEQG